VLRLYPPIPINERIALRDTILPTGGGINAKDPIIVPKGTTVAFSVYAMHRRPDIFGLDSEVFRPERWEEDDLGRHVKWAYLPFQGGGRACLGSKYRPKQRSNTNANVVNHPEDFAITQASYLLYRLIQRFPAIHLPPEENVLVIGKEKQSLDLVLSITEGCYTQLG
jgi:hypothetical protein